MRTGWKFGRMQKGQKKTMGYFHLLDELEESCCPICNRIRKLSWKFLDNLYYESVNDVGMRVKLSDSKGFCNFHAWMSVEEIRNSNSGIAIIYKGLLDYEIGQLSRWLKNGKRPTRWKRLWTRKRNNDDLLASWFERGDCPICEFVKTHEKIDIHILLDFIDEETFSKKFDASAGLCVRHMIKTCEIAGSHPNLPILAEKQLTKYRFLSKELGEYDRKRDYRFASEPKGAEVHSWRRVIAQFAGLRDIFGNDRDRKK